MQTIEEKLLIGRNETVEFLTTIDEIVELAKIAVAFSNNNGGSILIGVNSKGKLIGVLPEPEKRLVEEMLDFVEGDIFLESIIHTVKHYFILEIRISKSTLPIKLKSKNKLLYYYRIGEETVEANKIVTSFLNLKRAEKQIYFTSDHEKLLSYMESNVNLSSLYKTVDLKSKTIDKLLIELIYLGKVKISIVDKSFYYSKV